MLNRPHTEESKAKISAAKKGRSQTDEHKAKISAALTGRKQSPAALAKRSATLRGRKHSDAHCEAQSKKMLEFYASEAGAIAKQNMSIVRKGIPKSEETKAKMSKARLATNAKRKGGE